MVIASGMRLVLRPDVVSTVIDDGAVLLDLESKFFYELNATGWFVASRLETGASVDEVIADCRAAGMSGEDEGAVRSFLATLATEALVESADGADTTGGVPASGPWTSPTIRKQREPLQQVMVSAFDPSVPLME